MRAEIQERVDAVRAIAEIHGYAIGVHGSQRRDLDLIAVPWVEHADTADELIAALCDGLGCTTDRFNTGVDRPHGRRGWALGGGKAIVWRGQYHAGPSYIDISVMPVAA